MTCLVPDASALWRLIIPRDRKETAADKLRAAWAPKTTEGQQQ